MGGVVIGSTIMNLTTKGGFMGGLVAGSSMLNLANSQSKWGAVIINSGCNLDCPRCYLGKKNGNVTMSQATSEKIMGYAVKNWEGIAIIGTEPLLDEESVAIIKSFSHELKVHLITNGINLFQFASEIKDVQRIDLSLDGGQKTYCRSDKFEEILSGAKKWKALSGNELYILHVLSQENCKEENVSDMLEAGILFEAKKVIFSPYIQTIGGRSILSTISIREIVAVLKNFTENSWQLILDPYHAIFEARGWEEIKEDIAALNSQNFSLIEFDPGDRIERVDINGRKHHPFMRLHPGISLPGKPLS